MTDKLPALETWSLKVNAIDDGRCYEAILSHGLESFRGRGVTRDAALVNLAELHNPALILLGVELEFPGLLPPKSGTGPDQA